MVCARCGHASSSDAGRCLKCGAPSTENVVATGVNPIDTTGLRPGATFEPALARPAGARADAPTIADAATLGNAATMGDAATMGATVTADGTGAAAPREPGRLRVGQSFGARYHLIKLLGAGGMGAVYQAWDAELGVAVALKVIRTGKRRVSADLEKRFKNELLLARSVTHKNVVRIHDLGEIEGTKYITMSYVQGHDLSTLLRREGKFPIARALHLARQIAAGLDAAHEAGVVHRDLKPANIMIGADDLALIMDFGISASAEEATSGGVVGTLEYMAPEQGTGQAVDGRADIYAFGLILYELLTGPRLVASAMPQDRVEAMKYRTVEGMPSVRSLDSSISVALDALVTRCLERDPAARYQSSAELRDALAKIDDAGELVPELHPVSGRTLAGSAVLVVALVTATWWLSRGPAVPVERPPLSILVADFENGTHDRVLEGTIEQSLGIALEDASFITAFPRANAVRLAEQLGSKRGIDEATARLIAVREGVNMVVAGGIESRGGGYRINVRALDPEGKPLQSLSANASGRNDVLRAVSDLASRLRDRLGDTTPASARQARAETFTAASLDAAHAYAVAQDALYAGTTDQAIATYRRALSLDPNLGRASAGLATAYANLGQRDNAEKYYQLALSQLDRMTERERFRTRGSYYLFRRDTQKALEELGALVKAYPSDSAALANLALAYFYTRDFPKALEEGQRASAVYPKNIIRRNNVALYAMYAGDFDASEKEAAAVLQLNPAFPKAILATALSQLAGGRHDEAVTSYNRLGALSPSGASYAAVGLADLALYDGRLADAKTALEQGAARDLAAKNSGGAAVKQVMLASIAAMRGQRADAARFVKAALDGSRDPSVMFLAGRLLVETGKRDAALTLAADLEKNVEADPRAYGLLLRGEAALAGDDPRTALELFAEAKKQADTWLGRYDLGRANLKLERWAEASSEFDLCLKRRGEATALFLDDVPTYRFFPPVLYYLGQVKEGLKSPAAEASYRDFLAIKDKADPADPLVGDARVRQTR